MTTIAYGAEADQVGDLFLPEASQAPLVCLFHGGFWRMPYGRDELGPMARDLSDAGFAVWNLEYRRVRPGRPGWPVTFHDVDAVLAQLPRLAESEPSIDLTRLALVGHSAGGHLAFWAATRAAGYPRAPRPAAVVGLAPILDLVAADATGLGDHAAAALLGGSADEVPERYAAASPRMLVPLGVLQYVFHGDADAAVPLQMSRDYVIAARRAGDDATCVVLNGTDHMAFVDPASEAHRRVRDCLREALRV